MKPEILEQISAIEDTAQFEYYYWLNCDQEDLTFVRSCSRELTLELWPDAHMIYRNSFAQLNKALNAAVGVGRRFYDDLNLLEKKQESIQIIAPWRRVDNVAPLLWEARLWSDAAYSARLHYQRLHMQTPLFDARTAWRVEDSKIQ